jgi:hypothetical protein
VLEAYANLMRAWTNLDLARKLRALLQVLIPKSWTKRYCDES